MRLVALYLLFLLFSSLQVLAINPQWVKMDKKMIAEVNAITKTTPVIIERYFAKNVLKGHNLGFGWRSRELAVYGGYTSVYATFYYRNDSLVSYVIHPYLPDEPTLKKAYITWYAPSFRVNPSRLNPFYFNKTVLSKPLPAYQKLYTVQAASQAIINYMSPESGVVYGYAAGESPQILENRASFINIQNNLPLEQVMLLMYASNPASRLTAIEYYLKNKKLFSNQAQIEQWIETVFQELPEVESLQGCIGGKYNARELVAMFTETK